MNLFEPFGRIPVEYWDYGVHDLLHGLRAPWAREEGRAEVHLPGIGDCIPVRSARCAIALALQALDLPARARVAAPLYCCPVVFQAIRAAGMSVCFVDVDPDSFCMRGEDLQAKRNDCDAVVAVHSFGHLCDVQAIAAFGLPMIEDCALALESRSQAGPAGSFGDISVFSFRSGKYLSVGEGGALHARDSLLRSKLRSLVERLPQPSAVEDSVHAVKTLLRSALRSRPLWGLAGERLWRSHAKAPVRDDPSPIVLSKMFRSDLRVVHGRITRLKAAVAQQRLNADYYAEHLRANLCRHPQQPAGQSWNRYLYPLLFDSAMERDRVALTLHRQGISTAQPYRDVAAIAAAQYGYAGDCPQAERIAQRVLVLPSAFTLTPADLQRVAHAFNQACMQ